MRVKVGFEPNAGGVGDFSHKREAFRRPEGRRHAGAACPLVNSLAGTGTKVAFCFWVGKIPLNPKFPERTCWGCDKYCPAESLRCGNGTIRAPHPVELFGEDWLEAELPTRGKDR